MIRCFPSVFIARAEGALCHVGLADLKDPEDPGAGDDLPGAFRLPAEPGARRFPDRREAELGVESGGASLVYGNKVGSRRL